MAALLSGQLLLQGSFAVVQQQILVVLEIALAAVLGEESMGHRVHGELGDEHHHFLALGKGLLHKVKGCFQRRAGGLLSFFAVIGQRLELPTQQLKGLLGAGGVGAAQFAFPPAQHGLHLQASGQGVVAQQARVPLMLGLGIVVCDLLAEQLCRAVRQILRQGSQGLFRLPQEGIAGIGHRICLPGRSKPGVQARQKQADQRQSLVKRGLQQPGEHGRLCLPGQDLLHAVVIAVLIVKVQIGREVLSDLRVLDVFLDEVLIGLQAQLLVGIQQIRQVLPAAGGDELGSVHVGVDLVEVLRVQFQIAQDGAVDVSCPGVVLPHRQVGLNVHAAHTVEGDDVKVPDGFVVLRRVACCHDDPARRHSLVAEGLALQKLQHGGRQRLGHTVDLVDEQDALRKAGGLHFGVDAGDDLAHGVLGHRDVLVAVVALPDKGQTHGALAGVMGDGIGHQCHPALSGHLLHHLGLTDARRPHEQDGPLSDGRDGVFAQGILGKVGLDGVFDLFFGAFDVHNSFPLVSGVVQVTVQVVLFGQRVGKSAGRAGRRTGKFFFVQHHFHSPGRHIGVVEPLS